MRKQETMKVGPSHTEPVKSKHAHPSTHIHQGLEAPDTQKILDSVHMAYRHQLKQPDHEPHEAMVQEVKQADIKRSLPSDVFVKYGDGMSKHEDAHYDGRR